jgi:hypothetical protein
MIFTSPNLISVSVAESILRINVSLECSQSTNRLVLVAFDTLSSIKSIPKLDFRFRFASVFAHGHWPPPYPYGNNQPFDMRRSLYNQNNYNLPQNNYNVPQNYHYQQMNGHQLVNHRSPAPQPPCECIKLSVCSPVMNMASQMYSGFIADYINSQIQVIACNFIDGEMAVCCPKNNPNKVPDSREKRGNGSNRFGYSHDHNNGGWVWDSEDASFENINPPPQKYPQKQYTPYPIQGFYPYSNNPFLKNIHKSPFYANHEDPGSMKNCPPPFSEEFKLPKNHTFYKEPEVTTTIAPRVEVTTPAPQNPESLVLITPEMQAKMYLINEDACGRSVGSRIIGGEDAGVGRFSWMARLAYRNKSALILISIFKC